MNAAQSNSGTWHATTETTEQVKTLCGVTAWTENNNGDLVTAVIDYSNGYSNKQIIECEKCERKVA
jgi:hypothetical protein